MKPEPNVIRFVRRYFPGASQFWGDSCPARVLDIGSGSGNHAQFFEDEGWDVMAVDSSPSSRAHRHIDIRRAVFEVGTFDLILDHNTLCHVEDPPYKEIQGWLASGGWFLCVHPAQGTWEGVADGKRYTFFAGRLDMETMMKGLRDVEIEPNVYPDYNGHLIQSWVAWGRK